MLENGEDPILKELFRESLSRELSRPEIQDAKKQLLSEFFSPAPQPVFSFASAAFLVPAAAVLTLCFFFGNLQHHYTRASGPAAPIYQTFGTIMEEAKAQRYAAEAQAREQAELKAQQAAAARLADDPVRNHMKPRVEVKRVSSRVGPTMVYQRSYQEVPVTIIWVFKGGGHHS